MPGLADVQRIALECTRCPLAAGRTTVVFGEGNPNADLMVVGEGPGREEDLQGRPFVGRSGQLLDRLLAEETGLRRAQVYIANVVKCRPPGNRDPLPEEIAACRPFLDQQVALIAPRVVVSLGNFATRLLLDTGEGITRLRGRSFPFGTDGGVLVPTYHPAAALRGGGEVVAKMRADFVRARVALDAAPGRPSVAGRPLADDTAPARPSVAGRPLADDTAPGRPSVAGRPLADDTAPGRPSAAGRPLAGDTAPARPSAAGRPVDSDAAPGRPSSRTAGHPQSDDAAGVGPARPGAPPARR